MPWKESNRMDELLKFITRLLDGETMSSVCREFGISRKTGYKIVLVLAELSGNFTTSFNRGNAFSLVSK